MTAKTPQEQAKTRVMLKPCDRRRVLIVDDDEEIREVFELLLGEELPECTVETAVNGADAFEHFQASRHGVLIVDLHMPVMDGEEAFEEIKSLCDEERWELPTFIFCTAYNPPRGVRHIVAGNEPHVLLRKPVPNEILVNMVKEKLGL